MKVSLFAGPSFNHTIQGHHRTTTTFDQTTVGSASGQK